MSGIVNGFISAVSARSKVLITQVLLRTKHYTLKLGKNAELCPFLFFNRDNLTNDALSSLALLSFFLACLRQKLALINGKQQVNIAYRTTLSLLSIDPYQVITRIVSLHIKASAKSIYANLRNKIML